MTVGAIGFTPPEMIFCRLARLSETMRRIVSWIAAILGIIILLPVAVFIAASFSDGPVEVIRGGPFRTGELVTATTEPDWSAIADRPVIEFQLVEPPTSRVIWVAVVDNRLYVLSGYMKTGYGRLWKHWPLQAARDNRALLRVDGKIYPRALVRLSADEFPPAAADEFERKYRISVTSDQIESGATWVYELAPRPAG